MRGAKQHQKRSQGWPQKQEGSQEGRTSLEGRLGGGQQGTADYSLHSGSERPPGRIEHAGGMGQ